MIAGFDPNSIDESGNWFKDRATGLSDSDGITWVHTAFAALVNAINARTLKATIRRSAWQRGWDEEPGDGEAYAKKVWIKPDDAAEACGIAEPQHIVGARVIIYRVAPDWRLTTVTVEDLYRPSENLLTS